MAPLRFESPVPALTEAWERAIPLLTSTVAVVTEELRHGRLPPAPGSLTTSCWMAHALLVAGEREPARDLCHVLARGVERGTIPPAEAVELPALLERLVAWTGADAAVERYAAALGRVAGCSGATDRPGVPELKVLLPEAGPSWSPDDSTGHSAGLIHGVIYGMWGLAPDAGANRLALSPQLPAQWRDTALHGLRHGPTTVDLVLRVRPGAFILRVARVHGPPLGIDARPAGIESIERVTVDEHPLGAGAVRFEAGTEHEVVWTTW